MNDHGERKSFWGTPAGLATIVFLAAAAYFLWTEHQAHVIAFLPYSFLFLCAGMHLFMHRGHGGHGHHHKDEESRDGR